MKINKNIQSIEDFEDITIKLGRWWKQGLKTRISDVMVNGLAQSTVVDLIVKNISEICDWNHSVSVFHDIKKQEVYYFRNGSEKIYIHCYSAGGGYYDWEDKFNLIFNKLFIEYLSIAGRSVELKSNFKINLTESGYVYDTIPNSTMRIGIDVPVWYKKVEEKKETRVDEFSRQTGTVTRYDIFGYGEVLI